MTKPVEHGMYAFNAGRAGDFLLFVSEVADYYVFLEFPGNTTLCVEKEDFSNSVEVGIIELAEQLPIDIFKETVKYVEIHEKKKLASL